MMDRLEAEILELETLHTSRRRLTVRAAAEHGPLIPSRRISLSLRSAGGRIPKKGRRSPLMIYVTRPGENLIAVRVEDRTFNIVFVGHLRADRLAGSRVPLLYGVSRPSLAFGEKAQIEGD